MGVAPIANDQRCIATKSPSCIVSRRLANPHHRGLGLRRGDERIADLHDRAAAVDAGGTASCAGPGAGRDRSRVDDHQRPRCAKLAALVGEDDVPGRA